MSIEFVQKGVKKELKLSSTVPQEILEWTEVMTKVQKVIPANSSTDNLLKQADRLKMMVKT